MYNVFETVIYENILIFLVIQNKYINRFRILIHLKEILNYEVEKYNVKYKVTKV